MFYIEVSSWQVQVVPHEINSTDMLRKIWTFENFIPDLSMMSQSQLLYGLDAAQINCALARLHGLDGQDSLPWKFERKIFQ
jgi:hypothetical protein